jgi:glycosyltransferase involved in cell wall biosynthesis
MSLPASMNHTMKPKVLYIIDTLQIGGAEKSILDIASKLMAYQPVVCQLYQNDQLKEEFDRRGIEVIKLGIAERYNFISAYRALKRILKQEQPSLVVATLMRSELISRVACFLTGVTNIGTFVNDTYSDYEWNNLSVFMKVKVGFFWFINMLTARLCKGFLSNAESIKKSNCRALFIPASKVEVIYRGRRTDVFRFSADRFNTDRLRFLAVGRLLARKGYNELIHAFHQFHQTYPTATLSIAGDGPYRAHMSSLIAKFGLQDAVHMLGGVNNVPDLMATHDCLVFPSHYEGFSGTLIEAMLAGLPIIASDIEMNKEAVSHNETARLFRVMDSNDLLENMIWVRQHPREALDLAIRARKIAERRFDIEAIARQHESYYDRLITAIN